MSKQLHLSLFFASKTVLYPLLLPTPPLAFGLFFIGSVTIFALPQNFFFFFPHPPYSFISFHTHSLSCAPPARSESERENRNAKWKFERGTLKNCQVLGLIVEYERNFYPPSCVYVRMLSTKRVNRFHFTTHYCGSNECLHHLNASGASECYSCFLPMAGSSTACAACSSLTGVLSHIFFSFIATGESESSAVATGNG